MLSIIQQTACHALSITLVANKLARTDVQTQWAVPAQECES